MNVLAAIVAVLFVVVVVYLYVDATRSEERETEHWIDNGHG